MSGSTPPPLILSISSVPSSMMVRSAAVSVSNTLSKPTMRSAETILPVTSVPNRISEFFTQCCSHCRCCLNNDILVGIVNRIPYLVNASVLLQRTGRAYIDALTTVYADCIIKTAIFRVPIIVLNPLFIAFIAPTVWISLQMLTHLLQSTQRFGSL